MIEIEAAKKDLKKAQKKQSKAQARLEERSTTLLTLETRLGELRAQSPQAATDATGQSATDAEPTSLLGEEATLPEDMVVIQDMTGREAMLEKEIPVDRAPAPKTAAARTSTGDQTTST
jgi:chromosome segregation ATPase